VAGLLITKPCIIVLSTTKIRAVPTFEFVVLKLESRGLAIVANVLKFSAPLGDLARQNIRLHAPKVHYSTKAIRNSIHFAKMQIFMLHIFLETFK